MSGSLFLFVADTKGIFSVSPEECDILPLKTASFRLTFRPVSIEYNLASSSSLYKIPCANNGEFMSRLNSIQKP